MNENNKETLLEVVPVEDKMPDESPGINIEAKIRIFDPESKVTLFEGRA